MIPPLLVIFDGECGLCQWSVAFITRRDRHARFHFVSAQSKAGRQIQQRLGIDALASQSVVLVKDGTSYYRSRAALEITRRLDGAWKLLYAFRVVPRALRDPLYDLISHNRHRLTRVTPTCMMPTEELQRRMLDD